MAVTKYRVKGGYRWRVRISDPTVPGGMRSVAAGITTRREAKEIEAAAIAAGQPVRRETITVAELRDRWLAHSTVGESTKSWHRQQTRRFAAEHGQLRPSEVTRDLAVDWRKIHPSSTMALSALWHYGRAEELIDHGSNPWRGMASNPRRKITPGWLTTGDIEDLTVCAREAWPGVYGETAAGIVLMSAYVMLRPGELGGLWWPDLMPESNRVRLERQTESKTRKITDLKYGDSRLEVYPPIVQRQIARMARLHDEHVFTGPGGGLLWESTRNRIWHPIRVRFGRPTMDLYELRHFGATLLVESGLPSSDVAHQLGHQDGGRLVEQTYQHARPKPALDRIEAALLAITEPAAETPESEAI